MRPRSQILLLFLVLALLLPASGRAAEQIAIMDIAPWYLHSEGGDGGILIELSQQLFANTTLPQVQVLPPRRIAAELSAGTFHWLYWPCHMQTPGFNSLGTALTVQTGMALRADSPVQVLTDLRGQRVGVWTTRFGLLPELEQDQAIEKHEINKVDQGLLMLQANRLAGIALNDRVLYWHLRELGLPIAQFRYLPIKEVQFCLFGHQSLSEARRQQLSGQLASLVKERRLEQILARY